MNTHRVTVNCRTVYAGSRVECVERARRERQSWGPLYVVDVLRIDTEELQAASDLTARRLDRLQEGKR